METPIQRALEKSIEKWEKRAQGNHKGLADWRNCPLCLLFNNHLTPFGKSCIGCPVVEKTEKRFCADTPFHEYDEEWRNNKNPDKLNELARKEVDFLKSLRPFKYEG